MAFPVSGVLDDFNRADASVLGSNWSLASDFGLGGPDNQGISSNQLYHIGNQYVNYCIMRWNVSSFGPDMEAYLTINSKPTGSSGDPTSLIARMIVAASQVSGYTVDADYEDNLIKIFREDNNVGTQLGASIAQTISAGDRFGIECIGTTISAYYKVGAGSWTNIGSRTDATYASAGYIGFYLAGNEDNSHNGKWDDLGGGTIAAAVARTQSFMMMGIGN
jgi:hypothetical protein